jgi:hypothetical protein
MSPMFTGWCARGAPAAEHSKCPGVLHTGFRCDCECHAAQRPMALVITNILIPRCDATRGPRSTVLCELPYTHDGYFHHGRGAIGQWFCWPDDEGFDGRLRRRQRKVLASLEAGNSLWL